MEGVLNHGLIGYRQRINMGWGGGGGWDVYKKTDVQRMNKIIGFMKIVQLL